MAAAIYYRNTVMVHGIEAGALWRLENGKLVLVDDDQHVTSDSTEGFKLVKGSNIVEDAFREIILRSSNKYKKGKKPKR